MMMRVSQPNFVLRYLTLVACVCNRIMRVEEELHEDMLYKEEQGLDVVHVAFEWAPPPAPAGASSSASTETTTPPVERTEEALGMVWYESPLSGPPSVIAAAEATAGASWVVTSKAKVPRDAQALWIRVEAGFYPEYARPIWGDSWRGKFFYGFALPGRSRSGTGGRAADKVDQVRLVRHWPVNGPSSGDPRFEGALELTKDVERRSQVLQGAPVVLLESGFPALGDTLSGCVRSVSMPSSASALLIQPGWTVLGVDGQGTKERPLPLGEARVKLAAALVAGHGLISFRKRRPDIPEVGYAREVLRKKPDESAVDMTIKQRLEAEAKKPENTLRANKIFREFVLRDRALRDTNLMEILCKDYGWTDGDDLLCTNVDVDILRYRIDTRAPTRKQVNEWVRKWHKDFKAERKKEKGEAMDDSDDDDDLSGDGGGREQEEDEGPVGASSLPLGTRVMKVFTVKDEEEEGEHQEWFGGFVFCHHKIEKVDHVGVVFDDGEYEDMKTVEFEDATRVRIEPDLSPADQAHLFRFLEMTYRVLYKFTGSAVYQSDVENRFGSICALWHLQLPNAERLSGAKPKTLAKILARRILAMEAIEQVRGRMEAGGNLQAASASASSS